MSIDPQSAGTAPVDPQAAQSFDRFGPALPVSPVVLSVPHAGRDYPAAMQALLRLPVAALQPLEDRMVDQVAIGARRNEILLVQRPARAWIDLNRSEQERDPQLDDGADRRMMHTMSAKLRSGLGLIPRKVGNRGDIWRRRLSKEEVAARIASDHQPYHHALATALAAARARFGVAVLLDIHSMPPLGSAAESPRLVIGDRFGSAASARFVSRAEGAAMSAGVRHALNMPYAGGHILDRHARPADGIHAMQIELDRSLYLDAALDQPGPGLPVATALIRAIIDAVADEANAAAVTAIAAE